MLWSGAGLRSKLAFGPGDYPLSVSVGFGDCCRGRVDCRYSGMVFTKIPSGRTAPPSRWMLPSRVNPRSMEEVGAADLVWEGEVAAPVAAGVCRLVARSMASFAS